MVRQLVLIVAGAASLLSTPSFAQPGEDVKCLILSNAFGTKGSTDESKKVAQSAGFFYLGRIDGRLTDAQLRDAFAKEQRGLTAAKAGMAMQACAKKMQDSLRKAQSATR